VFGLEYDLDLFNIVAVDSFNMGAMENKGLNVFNTALVLADEATAADGDFLRIQSVVGHEYFHVRTIYYRSSLSSLFAHSNKPNCSQNLPLNFSLFRIGLETV
jgi:hypothetical protein